MAEPIKNIGKSPVGSASRELPVLERQVAPDASTAMPSFTSAFSQAAFTPTALGELGSTVAMQSGIALAKRSGESLGKTPSGDLLPAITPVDQAFVDSYSSQAQATLGIQATQLMNKGKEELSQAYRLSPGMIQDYTKNMVEGIDGILQHAPSTIRSNMQNQYAQELQSTIHGLNMNMISQNKEVAQGTAQVYAAHQLDKMHKATLNGNPGLAKNIYDTLLKTTQANLASGMLTPIQADTARTTAKISYYSSQEIGKAIAARHQNKLEGFLADMVDNKPAGVSWGEWEKVRNQTVGYIGAVENLDNRDQSLIVSQATAQAAIKPLNSEYIEKLRTQLSPTRFNNFMTSYVSKQKKAYTTQTQVATIQANWSKSHVIGQADKKTLNQAYASMVEATKVNAKKQGIALSDDDAQLEAASTAGTAIPMYVNKLNKGLQSGNPDLMMRDWQDYMALKNQGGQLTQGVAKESIAMGTMFNHFLEEGRLPQEAAAMAQESVMNQTEEMQKQREQIFKDWRGKQAKDATHRESWARNLAGISRGTNIANGPGFALHVQAMMEDNIKYTGNVAAAEEMLRESLAQYWGYTNLNGEKQFTYMPVETAINLPEGATPLIKQNMVDSLGATFAKGKEAFDKGYMPYYVRLKDDRPSLDEYLKAKNTARQKQTAPEIAKAIFKGDATALQPEFKIISEFESDAPLQVEMVHRGGTTESFSLNVNPSPLMQQSTGDTVIIGDYDVTMRDDKGRNYPIPGPRSGSVTHVTYRPNKTWIENHYFAVNGIDPTDKAAKERELSKRAREDEQVKNPRDVLLHRGVF